MHDASTPIADFLAAAAAKQPTPGGGSVAALAGALSAAIGEMVLNYSIGRKNLESFRPRLEQALSELTRARQMLLELMAEDQVAYEAVTAARKLSQSDPTRAAQQDAALLAGICVPEIVAATALAVLELTSQLVDIVNPFLLSDLAVSAELAMATLRCASYNVRVNLKDLKEPGVRASFESSLTAMHVRAVPLIKDVIPRIWARRE